MDPDMESIVPTGHTCNLKAKWLRTFCCISGSSSCKLALCAATANLHWVLKLVVCNHQEDSFGEAYESIIVIQMTSEALYTGANEEGRLDRTADHKRRSVEDIITSENFIHGQGITSELGSANDFSL
ncbi:hypothetical protein M513_06242 [Trichuris suis]|uniref:Uncharacterized protein n=1 Tax=Trichuris suis TaxID=68888 RepID=A0A085M6T6_9BILA|nr:hypothetical protein M513_06242 [Trichuris suis]